MGNGETRDRFARRRPQTTVTTRRALPIVVCALVACVAVLGVAAPAASAKTPCWKQLINDWYDGRIDKSYPVHCYREAQRHVPTDAQAYSSLPEDLDRALQATLTAGGPGDGAGPNTPVPAGGAGRSIKPKNSPTTAVAGSDDKGLLDAFRPSNADSVPIPLLVLAGLALLLLAAAAASFIARRVQGRRVPASIPPSSRRPRR
jgi:hypothetical protein